MLSAHAETIRLKGGETINGTVSHYYGGIVSILMPDGSTKTVGRNEIIAIEFESLPSEVTKAPEEKKSSTNFLALSKSTSKYGSPLATFETWRKAAIAGEVDAMADCYASFKQSDVKKQLKSLKKEDREKMRETTARTDFVPAEPFYQGDRAMLEIKWQLEMNGDSQVLQFIQEKNEWKIIQ